MAYVRQRGNQLAIVHGERDPETGKVDQRILFTLYSKAEAREALGQRNGHGGARLRSLLEDQYPDIRFNWKKIAHAISAELTVLPDLYEYKGARLHDRFRKDLCGFTRQLILADPQDLMSAAELIQKNREELQYLVDLIQWRLKLCDQKENKWNTDKPFYWRSTLRGSDVPPGSEEVAIGFYERGEYDRAEAVFRLFVDCFEGYAEGYNYLGLIALERERFDEAISHFEKTIKLGRRKFPKRIARNRYWNDIATRPYMRGLMNLAKALNRATRYDEALTVCDRLDRECDDKINANAYRASIYLNRQRWQMAAEAAHSGYLIHPSESLVRAFALFELGQEEEAIVSFLHGAMNHPRAARTLIGIRMKTPKSSDEYQDHNTGVHLVRALHGYLATQSPSSKRFFLKIASHPRVAQLTRETEEVVQRWHEQHRTDEREAFDRMQEIRAFQFACDEAKKLTSLQ